MINKFSMCNRHSFKDIARATRGFVPNFFSSNFRIAALGYVAHNIITYTFTNDRKDDTQLSRKDHHKREIREMTNWCTRQ